MLFACDNNQISGAVEFIRAELKKRKLRPAEISKAVLASEEIIRAMIAHAALSEENFQVRINAFMESVSVRITCRLLLPAPVFCHRRSKCCWNSSISIS